MNHNVSIQYEVTPGHGGKTIRYFSVRAVRLMLNTKRERLPARRPRPLIGLFDTQEGVDRKKGHKIVMKQYDDDDYDR